MKASPLLRAWLRELDTLGVRSSRGTAGRGWENRRLLFETPERARSRRPTRRCWRSAARAGRGSALTALGSHAQGRGRRGGAAAAGQLRLCGRLVGDVPRPLRRPAAQAHRRCRSGPHRARRGDGHPRGTRRRRGLCAVGARCARRSDATAKAVLHIDLRPDHSAAIWPRVSPRRAASSRFRRSCASGSILRRRHRPAAGGDRRDKHPGMTPAALAALIKAVPVRLTGVAPIARAISTAGGITFDAVDEDFMLRKRRACSSPARCSIGRRRPAAICCRRASRRAAAARRAHGCARAGCNRLGLRSPRAGFPAPATSPRPRRAPTCAGGQALRGLVEGLAVARVEAGIVQSLVCSVAIFWSAPRSASASVSSACLSLKLSRRLAACGPVARLGASPGSALAFGSASPARSRRAAPACRSSRRRTRSSGRRPPARSRACHDAVEEVAVVADEDDGAGIVAQHFLQHVERLEVEIVGRLVEHQQVRGLGQRARQHQPAALAAREHAAAACAPARARTGSPSCSRRRASAGRRPSPCRRGRRSAPRRASSSGRGCRGPGRAWPSARLAPSRTSPLSGASAPVSRLTSVVLPLPFGPTMPMRSPRMMRIEKSVDDRALAERLGDAFGLDHQRAGHVGLGRRDHAPCRRRRDTRAAFCRRACSSPMRRTLRLRRAVTP